MKKNAKDVKKNSKIKDLSPKSNESKSVKGGAVGPCNRSKK
jgi:hypothetical protein